MGIISCEAMELFQKVRDQYPDTHEWVKHKARWEGMPVGAVCMAYRDYIKELMRQEERGNNG